MAELVGTFFLTLAAMIAGTPYAVGLTLAAFVYAIGTIKYVPRANPCGTPAASSAANGGCVERQRMPERVGRR
jgi:hypothetical protein